MGKGKKDKQKELKASTVLALDKTCKSCMRYASEYDDENVLKTLYLMNDAYSVLGEPARVKVTVEPIDEESDLAEDED